MCYKTEASKSFLKRFYPLEAEYKAIKETLDGLQGMKYEQRSKSTSRKNVDTRLNGKLDKLDVIQRQMDEIEACIDEVEDDRSRTILRCKYTLHENLYKVSERMFYSYDHTKAALHPKALRQFYDVLVKRGHVKEQSV